MKAKLGYLSKEEQKKIHQLSCLFLAETGIVISSQSLIQELTRLGAEMKENRLCFSNELIEKLFAFTAKPSTKEAAFHIANRGFTSLIVDENTKVYRKVREKDISNLCSVVNTLQNVDFIALPYTDDEVLSLGIAVKETKKMIITPCSSQKSLKMMNRLPCNFSPLFQMESSNFIFSDEICSLLQLAIKKKNPFGIFLTEINWKNYSSSELILFFNIHNLAILLIAKMLQQKESVYYCGATFSNLSPKQWLILNTAFSEMASFYGIIPILFNDFGENREFYYHSAFERNLYVQSLENAVSNGILLSMGTAFHGNAYSLTNILLDQEILNMSKGFGRTFSVDAEHLGTDAINDVGPGGHFLFHPHTLKHFSHEIWRKKIEDSFIYQKDQSFQEEVEKRIRAIIGTV
ncbi:MAG: trimethylamine methyltransferase family protein [Clostridiales bacterium]